MAIAQDIGKIAAFKTDHKIIMLLSGYRQSLQFLMRMNWRKADVKVTVDPQTLVDGDGQQLEVDIYHPRRKKSRGLIVFYHGMNKYGRRDERVQAACDVFRSIGYTVIVPELNAVRELCIKERALNEIIDATRVIKTYADQNGFKKVGLFAASYTTSGAMYAITQEGLNEFASVMLTLGGCFIPENSFVKLLSTEVSDAYATAITIWNFFPEEDLADPKIEQAMRLIIDDAYEENDYLQTKAYLENADLTESQKQRIQYWMNEVAVPSNLYLDKGFERRYTAASQVVMTLFNKDNLKTPFVLIHSPNDTVLNSSETINFKALLDEKSIKNYMVLTDMLDHADFEFKLEYFKDLLHLVKAFARFFAQIN